MTLPAPDPYPGENAPPAVIFGLAREYQTAAHHLMQHHRRGQKLSYAPTRLCAIHAIELFFNAFLLSCGRSSGELRGMFHDLTQRADLASEHDLKLRKRTHEHLSKMSQTREYLVSRYGPELNIKLSEINRLIATLNEVSDKVGKRLGLDTPAQPR